MHDMAIQDQKVCIEYNVIYIVQKATYHRPKINLINFKTQENI